MLVTQEVRGKTFSWDDTLIYGDFAIVRGNPEMFKVDIAGVLQDLDLPEPEKETISLLRSLERWNEDVPRKKRLAQMRRDGMNVLTSEILFDFEGGDEYLGYLENSGVIARRILTEVLGLEPMNYWAGKNPPTIFSLAVVPA